MHDLHLCALAPGHRKRGHTTRGERLVAESCEVTPTSPETDLAVGSRLPIGLGQPGSRLRPAPIQADESQSSARMPRTLLRTCRSKTAAAPRLTDLRPKLPVGTGRMSAQERQPTNQALAVHGYDACSQQRANGPSERGIPIVNGIAATSARQAVGTQSLRLPIQVTRRNRNGLAARQAVAACMVRFDR